MLALARPFSFVCLLTAVASAQAAGPVGPPPLGFDVLRRAIPVEPFILGARLADMDGDGQLDLVRRTPSSIEINLGDGEGRLVERYASIAYDQFADGDFGLLDANADGLLDLVVARAGSCFITCSDAQTRLLVNAGGGTFLDQSALFPSTPNDPHGAVAVGDVDADGDVDVVLGGFEHTWFDPLQGNLSKTSPTVVWTRGAGSSYVESPASGVDSRAWKELVLADFDGDGAAELLAWRTTGPLALYQNDGTGSFTVSTSLVGAPVFVARVGDASPFDADGDGDLDLLVSYFGSGQQVEPILFVNDGTGTLTQTPAGFSGVLGEFHAVGDLDADGDQDVVVCGVFEAQALLNDGTGAFGGPTLVSSYRRTGTADLGDVDGDGDADLLTNQDLHLGDGTGALERATDGTEQPWTTEHVAELLDFDGDGDLDAAIGNRNFGLNQLLENDGAGRFRLVPAGVFEPQSSISHLDAADVNGDGLVDLGVSNRFSGNDALVYLAGGGSFSGATVLAGSDAAESIALGDVDGDGAVDAVVGRIGTVDRLHIGNGLGGFTFAPGALPATPVIAEDLLLADLDGDGDLDLSDGSSLSINGAGTFALVAYPTVVDIVYAVRAADADLDGDLDLMLGTSTSGGGVAENRLLLNDGVAGFTDASASLEDRFRDTRDVLFGDVDGDGDPDAVWSDRTDTVVLENDGVGAFSVVAQGDDFPTLWTDHAPAGDVDGDGDLDLFNAALVGCQVLTNLNRQISATTPPKIGRTLRLRLDSPLAVFWAVYWSPNSTGLPLGSVGTLWLDPGALNFVGTTLGSTGTTTSSQAAVSVLLPMTASLVGQTVFTQANSYGSTGSGSVQFLLSNLETLTITDL